MESGPSISLHCLSHVTSLSWVALLALFSWAPAGLTSYGSAMVTCDWTDPWHVWDASLFELASVRCGTVSLCRCFKGLCGTETNSRKLTWAAPSVWRWAPKLNERAAASRSGECDNDTQTAMVGREIIYNTVLGQRGTTRLPQGFCHTCPQLQFSDIFLSAASLKIAGSAILTPKVSQTNGLASSAAFQRWGLRPNRSTCRWETVRAVSGILQKKWRLPRKLVFPPLPPPHTHLPHLPTGPVQYLSSLQAVKHRW